MTQIDIGPDGVQIDADIVAKALRLTPEALQAGMRDGTVTSQFETGQDEDAGCVRLTFYSANRRARITADMTGAVLSCTAVDYKRPFAFGPLTPAVADTP